MIARVQADFYKAVISALKPTGAAWPVANDAIQVRQESAQAEELARAHNRAHDLLDETDPRRAFEILDRWEDTVARDACFQNVAGLEARRAFAHGRWIAKGGASRAYFIGIGRALGYEIAIEEFKPFCCDDPCDGDLWDQDAVYVWRVTAPGIAEYWMTADARAADPIREWDERALECLFRRLKPAHTTVVFNYG